MKTQSYQTTMTNASRVLASGAAQLAKAEAVSKPVSDMLSAPLTDRKSLWIENAEIAGNWILVEYCHEYLLNSADPDWTDVKIARNDMTAYILATEANKWESLRPGFHGIETTQHEQDAETCLLEMDPTDRKALVAEYIQKGGRTWLA